jgi:hypothetical protein
MCLWEAVEPFDTPSIHIQLRVVEPSAPLPKIRAPMTKTIDREGRRTIRKKEKK